jgi:aminopeptidase
MDPRNTLLAENLVNYSCSLKKGEKILIELKGLDGMPLLKQIIKEVYKANAIPFVHIYNEEVDRELLLGASEEQLNLLAKLDVKRMSNMDAYIGIRATSNTSEISDVPPEKHKIYSNLYSNPVHIKTTMPNTKWVALRYPNPSMSQLANTSREAFSEFYYNVCNLDYAKMDLAMNPLKDLMEKTDKVRITGKGTDLTFSIKDIGVVKCAGVNNIPDGEIYTAPVKNSVNGVITYNIPSSYQGFKFDNIKLEFKDGKIVNATANNTEKINKVFDTDEGSRFIGEFAIGVNPYILDPMNDTLFDEKIMGSFHFTPGNAYKEAFNGNTSSVHWDLVCIQTEAYGGGEIYFDDVLIRKDGMFVIDSLKPLNPENLK